MQKLVEDGINGKGHRDVHLRSIVKIGIIIGSIRQERKGGEVGRWVESLAGARSDADYERIDLRSFDVPLLTSPTHPMAANRSYESEAVQRWSLAIDRCDAYVFVTPEYNHGVPGGFKNAVDSLGPEWMGKAVAFVSYGSALGVRAVEHWRQIAANFSMVDVRSQVTLSIFTDLTDDGSVQTSERLEQDATAMFDELVETTRRIRR